MPSLEETNFIDALVAAGIPRQNIEVVDFSDTTPTSLDIPPVLQDDVILKGESIAVIRDSDGVTSSIVIFRPTSATRKAAQMYEGQDVALHVDDANGLFTPRTPQRITGSVYEPANNTMIVTTENQS